MRRRSLRPNTLESEEKVGWKTVEDRRKDVPHQKAAIAVPLRDLEMICGMHQLGIYVFQINRVDAKEQSIKCFEMDSISYNDEEGGITGRATESDVASKATARVIMQRLVNEV